MSRLDSIPEDKSVDGFSSLEPRDRLFNAVKRGNIKRCQAFLRSGFSVNTANDAGHSLLMLAALNGQAKMIEYLCGRGVDLNQCSNSGKTALYYAAEKGIDVEVRKGKPFGASFMRLIEAGADWRISCQKGLLPAGFVANRFNKYKRPVEAWTTDKVQSDIFARVRPARESDAARMSAK